MRFFPPLAALLFVCSFLQAQPTNMTLEEANKVALERNLSIISADANVGAAQAGVTSAYGGYLPGVSASGSWTRSQVEQGARITTFGGVTVPIPASNSTTNNFNAGVNARMTLFDGFNRQAQVGQAVSHSVATEQTAVRTRQSIIFQVESSYLNVLRNEELVKVADENLKRDNRQLEKIVESNKVGAAALADVYRQQSAVAADEYALISAQATFDKSKADLVDLIGLDVGKEYTFNDPTISLQLSKSELDSTASLFSSYENLSKRSIAARPDYKSALESYNAAASGVTSAKSLYFPSLAANAGYGLNSNEFRTLPDNRDLSWGLSLSWTIFDGFNTNAGIQSAIATQRIAEITLAQTERDINAQLRKALLDFDAARKQYEVSQKGVTSATEDQRIAEEKYNLGAGTLLDLLTANANLVLAQVNLVNSVYNYITAKKNVDYTIGERMY